MLKDQGCEWAYMAAYADKIGNWSWEDGSAWNFDNRADNEMMGWDGNLESRAVLRKDGKWYDY
jgi:hypothetical protein